MQGLDKHGGTMNLESAALSLLIAIYLWAIGRAIRVTWEVYR